MDGEKNQVWGIQTTPETKEQVERLLLQMGGKSKKESFEKMLSMVEFHVTRENRKPDLCRKMDGLNKIIFELRDSVQDIIEIQDQEIHDLGERWKIVKQEKEELEQKIKELQKKNTELRKENKYLKENIKLSKQLETATKI